jgi:hypothetical protein
MLISNPNFKVMINLVKTKDDFKGRCCFQIFLYFAMSKFLLKKKNNYNLHAVWTPKIPMSLSKGLCVNTKLKNRCTLVFIRMS